MTTTSTPNQESDSPLSSMEGVRKVTAEELEPFLTIMRDEVIPAIVETMHQRAVAAAASRGKIIGKAPDAPRAKTVHIGAPACFALEQAIRPVCEAFGAYHGTGGCYVVGSVLERADWRDVDVRLILNDEDFLALFPKTTVDHCEHDARWLLLTVAIAERLSKLTGLPIDFQFQPQTIANARHKGRRNAIGLTFNEPSAEVHEMRLARLRVAIDSPAEDAVARGPADDSQGTPSREGI